MVDLTKASTYHNDRSANTDSPNNLNRADALRKIREIAVQTDKIIVVAHAMKRAQQRGVTRRQIELCVQKGTIQEGPFLNEHNNWQVTLFRHAAGEELICVVAIDWPSKALVITTYK
ncbi:MAG TPA: DUF4258 domain-containing protein [Sphingomicrobium sp.]|nr:DUF4258 domain-containing protein [Sphingomicrobium sp.]